MKKYLKIILIALILCFPATRPGCAAEVANISGDKYFVVVKDALLRAEKSVYVLMPAIDSSYSKNSKVNQLVSALIVDKERGLDVRVILDQPSYRVKTACGSEWRTLGRSIKAYARLKKAGVNVHYGNPRRRIDAAMIVVDKQRVVWGSTPWTDEMIESAAGANVFINSGELAADLAGYFDTVNIDQRIDAYVCQFGQTLLLPGELVENPAIVSRMMRNGDEREFDTYLFLLWKFDGNPEGKTPLVYEELAKYLGMDVRNVKAYRKRISAALKKLERKYALIRFTAANDKTAGVTLFQPGDSSAVYEIPRMDIFGLPAAYFQYGWNRQLSFRGKFCYLISLYFSAASEQKPFWSKSVSYIACQSGNINAGIISKGMEELQRKNLISIAYDKAAGPYNLGKPRVYELLPLRSPAGKGADAPAVLGNCVQGKDTAAR